MALLTKAEYERIKNYTNTDMRNARHKVEGNYRHTILATGKLNARTRQGYERYLARWYKLIPHPEQIRLIKEKKRFKVVPAGRRSGKTERAKRMLIKAALGNPGEKLFAGAPTRDQAKRIWWEDLKTMSFWRNSRYCPCGDLPA